MLCPPAKLAWFALRAKVGISTEDPRRLLFNFAPLSQCDTVQFVVSHCSAKTTSGDDYVGAAAAAAASVRADDLDKSLREH